MAGTAAAAVGSSLSPSLHVLKCMHSSKQQYPSDHSLLKLIPPSSRTLTSIFHTYATEPVVSLGTLPHKWRLLKLSAAVAQGEATAAAPVVEEEEQAEEVEGGDGEADQQAQSDSGDPVNTKLYFGNLPYNVDSAMLAGIIQEYGSPELIEVLYHRETGRSRGFAFVTMSTIEDCDKIIENLDGSEYLGRTLRVNFSDKPKARTPLYPETEYKLFVGNLSWSVTSESLTQAFQEYGNVVGARVLYDGETGRSRGYGFVCYATKSEMDAALRSLHGVELEGRPMRVSLAEGKKS